MDITYSRSGSRFDLPFISRLLGIDLVKDFSHHDLMLDCWRNNLYGGLKIVEVRLGTTRQLKGVDGAEAVRLWWRYQINQEQNALDTLLYYNKEDTVNLKSLKMMLEIE